MGGGGGGSGRRAPRAGTHPVFERPSIRQCLLSPPGGGRGAEPWREKGADSTCFQGLEPQGPSPSRSLSLPPSVSTSGSLCTHTHVGEGAKGITEGGEQKGGELGPPCRAPHPGDQFSGISHICLPSQLTWGAREGWVPGTTRKRLQEHGYFGGPTLPLQRTFHGMDH